MPGHGQRFTDAGIAGIDIVDAKLNFSIKQQLTGCGVKADGKKADLLFDLITEKIAFAQIGNLLRVKPVSAVGDLILYKGSAHCSHAVVVIKHGLRHRIDAVTAKGFNLTVNHCELGGFVRGHVNHQPF